MAQINYKRRLIGDTAGVVVNAPVDRSNRLPLSDGDSVFAAALDMDGGRLDRPFFVDAEKFDSYFNSTLRMNSSKVSDTVRNVYEGLKNGATSVVLSRIVSDGRSNAIEVDSNGGMKKLAFNYLEGFSSDSIKGAFAILVHESPSNSVSIDLEPFTDELGRKCVRIDIYSLIPLYKNGVANYESGKRYELLYSLSGCTDPNQATDGEDGVPTDIYTLAQQMYGDALEIVYKGAFNGTSEASFNGYVFEPQSYSVQNYKNALYKLKDVDTQFRYLFIDGVTADFPEFVDFGFSQNRKVIANVKYNGGTISALCAEVTRNTQQVKEPMYYNAILSTVMRDDPLGISGRGFYGTAGMYIGMSCGRNLITNGQGLPALNQPIAGKQFPVNGRNMAQEVKFTDTERAEIAKARINPVDIVRYSDGQKFVWVDVLTGVKGMGISKLSNAAEIAIWTQETWGSYANDLLFMPMTKALREMENFTLRQFRRMESSEWLSYNGTLGGMWAYNIYPHKIYPDEHFIVELMISIDGVVRKITIDTSLYGRSVN